MSQVADGVPQRGVRHGGQRPREYQLATVQELYPPWHPLVGQVIDTCRWGAGAPRLRRSISRDAAPPPA